MKFLVANYSCLQNPWLGGYRPQIPVLSVLSPQLNLLNPLRTKLLGTPLAEGKNEWNCKTCLCSPVWLHDVDRGDFSIIIIIIIITIIIGVASGYDPCYCAPWVWTTWPSICREVVSGDFEKRAHSQKHDKMIWLGILMFCWPRVSVL